MYKEKQKTYLSELFLEKLNEDFSQKAVLRAFEKCNDEILKRLENYQYAEELVAVFCKKDDRKQEVSKEMRQEFMDFRDVCREFNDFFMPEIERLFDFIDDLRV